MKKFETFRETPIPFAKPWNWDESRKQTIVECGEKLVPMSFCPEKILVSSQYFLQNLAGALPECYAREGVYRKILAAAAFLPSGYRFVILDCWRPLQVQQSLFDTLKSELRKKQPAASAEEITKQTLTYVALPSHDAQKPSPHNTGGAVDLTIADGDGLLLNMGTDFDDASLVAGTVYFERQLADGAKLSPAELEALQNRRLLYHCLTSVGFTNYAEEWWHFDYGNQNWAWVSGGKHAVYGKIAPAFAWYKEIE